MAKSIPSEKADGASGATSCTLMDIGGNERATVLMVSTGIPAEETPQHLMHMVPAVTPVAVAKLPTTTQAADLRIVTPVLVPTYRRSMPTIPGAVAAATPRTPPADG